MRLSIFRAMAWGAIPWLGAGTAGAVDFPTPLPAETIPKVETLPARYPTGWSFLNYAGDRIELRNVGADSREVKGQLQAHDSATLLVSTTRPRALGCQAAYAWRGYADWPRLKARARESRP